MKDLFIIVTILYTLWVVVYLSWPNLLRKKDKQRQSKPQPPAGSSYEEDIIVKSTFDLCHSLPEVRKAENQKNGTDKQDIFAPSDEPKVPARIPDDELDEVFSQNGNDNEPMDIDIPLEYEDGKMDEDWTEDEEEEPWVPAGAILAEGSSFEEIGAAVRTIVHHQTATLEEKEIAGGVLLEIRQTDMFEQVVQSAPGRGDIVTEVMNLHLAAFHRRLVEKSSSTRGNKGKEAPKDFDIRNFV